MYENISQKTANILTMLIVVLAMALTFSCSSAKKKASSSSVSSGAGSSVSPSSYDPTKGPFIDLRDGQEYNTVKIGKQLWMAKNMNYAVGVSKCYEDNPANCDKYGRLYDWATAKTICPSGWRLPSIGFDEDKDWDIFFINSCCFLPFHIPARQLS